MMLPYEWNTKAERGWLMDDLLMARVINTGTWQAMDISGSKHHDTHEMMDVTINYGVPGTRDELADDLRPSLPWADIHFLERTGAVPVNPPPSADVWPHAIRSNADHTNGGKFDHTYPERFWPRYAGELDGHGKSGVREARRGIRFSYGDLDDVIGLLQRNPHTRQAYLPVWFPEDTGATDNKTMTGNAIRVPCTLGYHFMIRENILTCRYYMRSCDAYRHLTNDIYLASRLMQLVASEATTKLPLIEVGGLLMYISSLHLFVADEGKVKSWPIQD